MRKSAIAAAVGLALAVRYQGATALPQGGEITAGQGKIGDPANGALTIRQDSQRLAIDWLKFGIGVGQSVTFQQPGASAIALNRVVGNEASRIYGSLSANGQVFLLNPNGVLFAPGSQVNVGGLVASTLKMSNEDFLAGRYVFSKGEKAGSVVNQGEITAGYAALLGPQVSNEGIITATLGTVALAAGEQITLKLNGTSLVGLTVDKGALDALAANKHLIRADGGTVILTAKATDDIIRNVVNNDGIIEARSISQRDGVIRLESTGSGITAVNGSLQAGEIVVTGDKVGLYEHAALTAPGGTILVGGNFQGQGPERNSTATYVAPGATLNADALGDGDGGRVIVWSDGWTRFYGSASARGGEHEGNGGFIEISGKRALDFRGRVDLAAPAGRAGVLLLDPTDIDLVAAGGNLDAFLPDIFAIDAGSTISVAALQAIGAGTILLEATNNINFGLAVTLQAGVDLTVTPDSDTSGAGAFNLSANLSTDVLTVNGRLNHTAGTLSVGSGSVSGLYSFSSPGGLSIGTGTFTLNGGMNWSGSGTISGVNSTLSTLSIPSGDTAVISGGNRSLSSMTYSNAGTTQVNLPAGNSLSVPLGAVIENQTGGIFEFVADQNSVATGGVFSNFGGTVRNSSAGTNSISLTSGVIGSTDSSTWQASTGRLNLDAGAGSGSFFDTTNIVGNGVHFTGGTFQFFNFMPSADQINGTVNLSGATFDVRTSGLVVNNTLNWTAGSISGDTSTTSMLHIASGATAVISGGNKSLGPNVTYSNAGTTQINLPVGNSLSVPLGAVIENQSTGLFEFVADQNSVSAGGVFSNIGGTVRNSTAGTNSISLTSGFIGSTDGSTWQASTGRLNLDAGAGSGSFFDTTNIVGNGVHFTGGTFQFFNFMPSANQINGTLNLSGATLDMQTNLTVNGPVNLAADTTVTLNTNSIVFQNTINGAHDLTITGSGAGTIALNGAIGQVTPLADLSITTGQAPTLTLPLTTLTGNLDVTTGGDIFQTARLIVGGTAAFDAGGGEVSLQLAANDFQGAVGVTSTAAAAIHQITDANNLTLGAVSIQPGAQLRLQTGASGTATGHLTQTVPLSMSQLGVQTRSNTTSDISLGLANLMTNTTNPFNLENVGSGTWGNVTLRNDFGAGSLALNFNGAWATITGNLDVRTVTGINQLTNIVVGGATTLDAGIGTISLQNVGNDFGGPVSVTGTAATDHRVTDANDLQLGAVSIHTNANLILQTGASGTATGHLTQTVPLNMSQLRVETRSNTTSDITLNLANFMSDTHEPFKLDNFGTGTWGDVRLRNDFVLGDLVLNPLGSWAQITGVLQVQTGAGISQTGPVVVGGAATLNAGNGTINLQNIGNDFQVVNLASTAFGASHRITDRGDLQLGTISVDSFADVQFQTGALAGNTGNLSQTLPLGTLSTPMRQIRVQTLSDMTSDITLNLTNFFSDTTEPFVLQNTGTGTWGNVSLRNDYGAGAFSVNNNGNWATISGNLSIQALTGITQANPITVVGTSRFETSNSQIQLTQNNDFQDTVTLVGGTNVAVQQGASHDLKVAPVTAPQLSLSSGLGIDLSAGTYAASVGPLSLSAIAPIELITGPVTFSGANGISILGAVAGPGALVMNQTNPANSISVNGSLGTSGSRLGGLTINESGSLGVQLGTTTGFVNGDLDVISPARIEMGSLAVSGTSHFQTNNHIVQLEGNNDFVGVVTVVGGALTSINQDSVNPLRVAPLTSDRLQIQSQQSNVVLTAGTYQAAFDTLDIGALGGNSITLGAGTVTLDAANGLTLAGNVEGPGALVLNQHGLGASFSVGGTLGTSGARLAGLTIDNASATGVQLSGSGAFVAGDLDITSAADIRLGTSAVTGTSRFEAGNAPAIINGNNDFVGLVTVAGANEVWIAQDSLNALRVAPLSANFMFLDSQQSNVQLSAGTYEATLGNVRIDTSFGNSIALGAGTVTLDAQNGVQLNGSVAGPGALSIHQRSAGGLISVGGSLGTSAARLGGLTIDDQSTIGMPLGTTQAFVAGNVDITAAGPIQFGAMAVSGTSRFDFQPGVQAGVNIFDPGNDFGGVVTVLDGTFVFLAHSGPGPLRVAPLSAENMTILSWQSDIQLAAGTYQSTVGSLDIGLAGGDAIVLGAGTVTLDGANGVSVAGGDVHGPGGLIIHQRNASGYLLSESLGTPGSRLASLAIDNASTNNLSLGDVNVTGAVSVQTAGDLTLPLGTVVSSSAGDVVLAGANFVNNAGSGALSPSGRWLVYSTSPAGSTEGALASATNTRLYNRSFAGSPPASIAAGNHLIYSAQPTLNANGDSFARSVGAPNPPFTFSVSGYVVDDGYTDTVANALLTGTLTSLATPASPAGPYAITQGTLASGSGYALSFTNGVLTVTAAPVPSVAAVPATTAQIEPIRTYLDTLAGIQANRVAAPLPVEYDRMVTIENGGMRLPEGLKP